MENVNVEVEGTKNTRQILIKSLDFITRDEQIYNTRQM